MPADRVAEHNKRMWERLAKAGMNYTRPFGRPPKTRAGMRRFMDPRQRLKGVRLDGARVLGLAAGGGWDPVIFAKLGGDVTVFVTRPISGTLLAIAFLLLLLACLPMIRKRREEVFVES